MRYRVTGLALEPAIVADAQRLADALARLLGVAQPEVRNAVVVKHSLDARRRPARHIYSIEADVPDAVKPRPRPPRGAAVHAVDDELRPAAVRATGVFSEAPPLQSLPPSFRPVIVGAGPAGLFAALALCRLGATPLILERGKALPARADDVERLWREGVIDPDSNVLFGEGGACAWSDGKIYTRTRSPQVSSVLRELVTLGAPARVLIDARPHIGADHLQNVLRALRTQLLAAGAEFRFSARVTAILKDGGSAIGVRLASGEELRRAPVLFAAGHGSRESYQLLAEAGVSMEAWSSAIGVRVEHPQALIDRAQYKSELARAQGLPPADYHLAWHARSGRGVYTFCMCPGGSVVLAAARAGRIVTNGMAMADRGGSRANAAIVVQVKPQDYAVVAPPSNPLSGLLFQEEWERRAFETGGGGFVAPAQHIADFLDGRRSEGPIESTYRPGVRAGDLRGCLPPFVVDAIAQSIAGFSRRLRGFDGPGGVMVGVETRTSCPLRLFRDDGGQAVGVGGLYLAGEGAGHSGGIVSAAIDGIECAEAAVRAARGA